ncbi:MAG: hypothetical protein RR444_09385, partial [Oscillospiraceae bacterium]
VINFFKNDLYGTGEIIFVWAYRAMAALGAALVALSVWKSKAYRKVSLIIMSVLFVVLIPFAIHLIAILGMNPQTHWIMIFPFVVAFMIVIKLMENFQELCEEQKESKQYKKVVSLSRLISWVGVILSVTLIFNWSILANKVYYCMQFTYETSYATAIRIADNITDIPGYTKDTPVLIGMDMGMPVPQSAEVFRPLSAFTGVLLGHVYYSDVYLEGFLSNYIGFAMAGVTQ